MEMAPCKHRDGRPSGLQNDAGLSQGYNWVLHPAVNLPMICPESSPTTDAQVPESRMELELLGTGEQVL